MISHDNLVWNAKKIARHLNLEEKSENFIAYLPFFHIATQIQLFLSLSIAGQSHIAETDAARGGIINTLQDFKPTFFLGVPRIFEKMANLENSGLENIKNIFSGAAPISGKILQNFKSKKILVRTLYGGTEFGAPFFSDKNCSENVGKPYEFAEVKIINENTESEGEICVRGRNVFMGYLNDVENTQKAIDNEKWFHTGDLGKFDSEGNLMVTGRVKEIIITSNGKTKI